MSEILGLVAAISGVVDVGTSVGTCLRSISLKWKKAPVEIIGLSNEISDLKVLLEYTKDACKRFAAVCDDKDFVDVLNRHMTVARRLLNQINDILEPLVRMRGFKKRANWIHLKESLMAKKEELQKVRANIKDLLQISNM
jgi:hypothetical protein